MARTWKTNGIKPIKLFIIILKNIEIKKEKIFDIFYLQFHKMG